MQHYFVKKENNNLRFNYNDFHHVKDVMRLKNNDEIICIFENKSYLCNILYTNNDYKINVIKELESDNELPIDIILYQALIKNDKFDLILQKACELGVKEIYPLVTSRSVVKIDKDNLNKKIMRYEKIVKEAAEQSTRLVCPSINDPINIKDIEVDNETLPIIAYEKDPNVFSLQTTLKNVKSYKKVAIVIGPEGGFSKEEVDILLGKGFKEVSLGKRILRAETASFFAISVIAHYIEGVKDE